MALHPTRRFVEGCLGYHAHSLLQVSKVIQESTYHITIIRSLTLQIQIKTYILKNQFTILTALAIDVNSATALPFLLEDTIT